MCAFLPHWVDSEAPPWPSHKGKTGEQLANTASHSVSTLTLKRPGFPSGKRVLQVALETLGVPLKCYRKWLSSSTCPDLKRAATGHPSPADHHALYLVTPPTTLATDAGCEKRTTFWCSDINYLFGKTRARPCFLVQTQGLSRTFTVGQQILPRKGEGSSLAEMART
ncbi:hypothetical protein CapIbe_004398 [Capra ibex]